MNRKIKIAILVSGTGSNMEAIIQNCQSGKISADTVAVISNNPEVYALTRAEELNVPCFTVNHRDFKTREEHERNIVKILEPFNSDVLVLAGYMRVVTPYLINEFYGKWNSGRPGIINIHPASTIMYQGTKGYEFALGMLPEHPERLRTTYITVHFVDEGIDTGEIIRMEPLMVSKRDTLETLKKKGLEIEHRLYSECLQLFSKNSL
jgi:phosphoribosylglycinamide formyltransferase-1